MVLRLLERGFAVCVWNRTAARVESLNREATSAGLARHLTAAPTPRECVRNAHIVLTSLSDEGALVAVLDGTNGTDGVIAGLAPDAVLVETSTIGRPAARSAAKRVRAAGGRYVDSPLSGSVGPARRGELMGLVGADSDDLARVRPVLDALCRRVLHAGAVGQGQALKVVLNGVGAHHFVAFASMLALGERAGLPRAAVVEAFTTGAFASPSYLGKREKVLARDWSPEFSLTLAAKDVRLNVELQDEVGLPMAVHRTIADEVGKALQEGFGEGDLFGIERHFSDGTGGEGSPQR